MGFLQLTGGAYTSRSLIAAAQRCVNLFPEAIPQELTEPFPTVHFCTPGLTLVAASDQERCRCLYTSFDGTLYAVYNQAVYRIDSSNQLRYLGSFQGTDPTDAALRDTPVKMCDNGAVLLIVDGTVDGYYVDVTKAGSDQVLVRIDRTINQGFLGADHICFQDTFFILNKPDSAQFYISLSNIDHDNFTAVFNVNFTALHSVTPTGDLTVGIPRITNISSMSEVVVGMAVSGVGILNGTIIASIDSTSQITISTNALVTNSATPLTISQTTTGTRYLVGDVLDLPGTGGAQVTVNAVNDQGAITAWGTTDAGAVVTQPANPVSTTGGAGTGAKFDVSYQDNTGAFDPFDYAPMTGQANRLVAVATMHRNAWMIGSTSFEVWINSGGDGSIAGSFPFVIYQDAYGDWGCAAKYSVCSVMNQIFWLSQDKFGHGIVMHAEALTSKRISTHAIEQVISSYSRIDDAIGMVYQQAGHAFYLLTFPSANGDRGATWCFDATTTMWHERLWIDSNGIEYRHVANAISAAYGKVYVGDWRNGNLYVFDQDNYTDNGNPIKRVRSFPHQIDMDANRRIMYQQLIAQMQVGSAPQGGAAQTIVTASFTAPDGTLLENYHNINNLGANFIKISDVEGDIIDNAVVAGTTGDMLYQVSGTPITPDYAVSFRMQPTGTEQPNPSTMFIIGRADPSHHGYKAGIASDGSRYLAQLTVGVGVPYNVVLGTLSSGYYLVVLKMLGSNISVSVQRSVDGNWVSAEGTWGASDAVALSIVDTTYTAAGQILLGATTESASVSAPTAATDAGYTSLVFEDDFISNSIAPAQNSSIGFKWYWAQRLGSPANPSEWHVNTTATATTISNGNTSGGANASALGGILQINTGSFPNANLISLPGWAMNTGAALPAVGQGHWGPCYMEAYIQFLPNQNASLAFDPANYTLIGWPAFWAWAAQGIGDYGFPGSSLHLTNPTEVDFLESFGNVTFSGVATPSTWAADIIHHDTGGEAALGGAAIDAEWHTYGFLWTGGHVQIFFDNVAIGSPLTLSPTYALDAQTLFLTLGTGPSWQMNVDWVRVWQ